MPVAAQPISSYPLSALFTWEQFVNRWGLKNIQNAANKDGTVPTTPPGNVNFGAVQDAFNYATDELYGSLRGGVLSVPLDFSDNPDGEGLVPPRVSRWAMILAYADLYDVRGWEDKNKTTNRIWRAVEGVYSELMMVKSGCSPLPEAAHVSSGTPMQVCPSYAWRQVGYQFVDGYWTFWWNTSNGCAPSWSRCGC